MFRLIMVTLIVSVLGCTDQKFKLKTHPEEMSAGTQRLSLGRNIENGTIIGYIDSVDSSLGVVNGWTCSHGNTTSIAVHIYCGASAGLADASGKKSILAGDGVANLGNEPAVNEACGHSGLNSAHRFQVKIYENAKQACNNLGIWAHGISPIGLPNWALNNSGKYVYKHVESCPFVAQANKVECKDYAGQYGIPAGNTSGQASWSKNCRNEILYTGGCSQPVVVTPPVVTCDEVVQNPVACKDYAGQFGIPSGYTEGQASWTKNCRNEIRYKGGCSQPVVVTPPVPLSNKLYLSKWAKDHGISLGTEVVSPVTTASLSDLTIPEGVEVYLDTKVINVKKLTINGRLLCDPVDLVDVKREIHAENIVVAGSRAVFECGQSESRIYKGILSIVLNGMQPIGHSNGKGLMAYGGGVIRIHGFAQRKAFTRLAQSVQRGMTTIIVRDSTQWQKGDQIVLATTSFDPELNDVVTITAVSSDGRQIQISPALKFDHNGQVQSFSNGNKTYALDESGFVANLSRNIKISSSESDPDTMQRRGAHVMVMSGGQAQLSGIEFFNVGQMGALGSYPFHWHRLGDGTDQYLKNSSIHNSFSRCVTIHGTNNVKVQNNVCFDHFGHGFFLEDGIEIKNTITGNIAIRSKRPPAEKALLLSDYLSDQPARFDSPSTFWISNPDNKIEGNVAIGSDGSGFWMSFVNAISCSKGLCDKALPNGSGVYTDAEARPRLTATDIFSRNIAQSSKVGFTWDGAADGDLLTPGACNQLPKGVATIHPCDRKLISSYYEPPVVPNFDGLVAYKNLMTGLYFRGSKAVFSNTILADNGASAFFAYNQELSNTLIVGISQFFSQTDRQFVSKVLNDAAVRESDNLHLKGITVYDGPFRLDNVHFAGFNQTYKENVFSKGENRSFQVDLTPIPMVNIGGSERFTNLITNVSFATDTNQKLLLAGQGGYHTTGIRDDSVGILSGRPNSIVVPNQSWNSDSSCVPLTDSRTQALSCDYQLSHVSLYMADGGADGTQKTRFYRRNRKTASMIRVITKRDIASEGTQDTEIQHPITVNPQILDNLNSALGFSMIQKDQYEYVIENMNFSKKWDANIHGILVLKSTESEVTTNYIVLRQPRGCSLERIKIAPTPLEQSPITLNKNGVPEMRLRFSNRGTTPAHDSGYGQFTSRYYLTCE